jgi:hypothetical protein
MDDVFRVSVFPESSAHGPPYISRVSVVDLAERPKVASGDTPEQCGIP